MTRKKLWLVLFFLCLLLPACKKHPATLTLSSPISVLPVPEMPVCPSSAKGEWQTWQVAQQPFAVRTLARDGDDVWFSNDFGIYRIDTKTLNYTYYEDVLPARILLPVGDGTLWADAHGSQLYFDGQTWITPNFETHIGSGLSISSIRLDHNGDLWFGISTFRSTAWFHYPGHVPPEEGVWERVSSGAPESWDSYDCDAWQAYSDGTTTYNTDALCRRLEGKRAGGSMGSRTIFMPDENTNTIWQVAEEEGKLLHISQFATTSIVLPPVQVTRMTPDPDHGVWLGTSHGLFYADDEGARWLEVPYTWKACLLPDTPQDIAVDAHGDAWAATRSGLFHLPRGSTRWELVKDPNLSDLDRLRPVAGLAAAPDGGVWATHGWDLWRVNESAPIVPVGVDPACVGLYDPVVDASGDVWASMRTCGLLQYRPDQDTWIVHHRPTYVEKVAAGSDGAVYAVGQGGLYVYTGETELDPATQTQVPLWTRLTDDRPELHDRPLAVAADGSGGAWLGVVGTPPLWHVQDGALTEVPFPSEDTLHALYVDGEDRLWVQGWEKIFLYDGTTFKPVAVPYKGIYKIAFGPDGRVWVLSDDALSVYDPAAAQ